MDELISTYEHVGGYFQIRGLYTRYVSRPRKYVGGYFQIRGLYTARAIIPLIKSVGGYSQIRGLCASSLARLMVFLVGGYSQIRGLYTRHQWVGIEGALEDTFKLK